MEKLLPPSREFYEMVHINCLAQYKCSTKVGYVIIIADNRFFKRFYLFI